MDGTAWLGNPWSLARTLVYSWIDWPTTSGTWVGRHHSIILYTWALKTVLYDMEGWPSSVQGKSMETVGVPLPRCLKYSSLPTWLLDGLPVAMI